MFKATFQPGTLFRNVIDSIKDLNDSANFNCGADGISCTTMDSSHIAMIAMTLPSQDFADYECNRPYVFGISIVTLSKLLKAVPSTATVQLTNERGEDVIVMNVFSDATLIQQYIIKLMVIDEEDSNIPEKEHEVVFKAPSSEFKAIVNSLKDVGENIKIVCKTELQEVVFSAEGDIGSASHNKRYNMRFGEGIERIEHTYSSNYLQKFAKAAVPSDTVIIHIYKEWPIVVEYLVGKCGRIKYYLAPKTELPNDGS